jgi:hypothetical protein
VLLRRRRQGKPLEALIIIKEDSAAIELFFSLAYMWLAGPVIQIYSVYIYETPTGHRYLALEHASGLRTCPPCVAWLLCDPARQRHG